MKQNKDKLNEDLLKAAEEGDLEGVAAALEGGVNVNAKDEAGGTALMFAFNNDYKEIIEILKKAGAKG